MFGWGFLSGAIAMLIFLMYSAWLLEGGNDN